MTTTVNPTAARRGPRKRSTARRRVTAGAPGDRAGRRLPTLDPLEAEAIHIIREVAGRVRAAGAAVLRRQGLGGHAAPGAPRRSGRRRCRSRCCTSTPATTSPRCSTTATRRSRVSALRLVVAARAGLHRRRPAARARRRHPQPAADRAAARRHRRRTGFDAVFGGGRRDEEKARAKERIFTLRDEFGQWDPRNQRPELWDLYNGRHRPASTSASSRCRNWTELDVWRYIEREQIELPALYYAHEREVFAARRHVARRRRVGAAHATTRRSRAASVRYRTVGDMTCTGAVESDAATVADVVAEVAAQPAHRARRHPGRRPASEAAMEDRKKEGYF